MDIERPRPRMAGMRPSALMRSIGVRILRTRCCAGCVSSQNHGAQLVPLWTMLPAPTPANTETGPLSGPGFFWCPGLLAHGQVVSAIPHGLGTSARHHGVGMPHPYISAINAPHVKVMGITAGKELSTARRTRGCHTLILRGDVKNHRKTGVLLLTVQISHTTQLFGLNYWEKRNSLWTIS